MLNQDLLDFYNLFARTNEILLDVLKQLKRIADTVDTDDIDSDDKEGGETNIEPAV